VSQTAAVNQHVIGMLRDALPGPTAIERVSAASAHGHCCSPYGYTRSSSVAKRPSSPIDLILKAAAVHPSSIGKDNRRFDRSCGHRPVCLEQAILVAVRNDGESVPLIGLDKPAQPG
jgi:hypothetical protein